MEAHPQQLATLLADPPTATKVAGLRYVMDDGPGIRRQHAGRGFRYVGPDDKPIRDPQELQRIQALAIPPAWTAVWISPIPHGHLQATAAMRKGVSSIATTRAGEQDGMKPNLDKWIDDLARPPRRLCGCDGTFSMLFSGMPSSRAHRGRLGWPLSTPTQGDVRA